jgi:hypothetical protein
MGVQNYRIYAHGKKDTKIILKYTAAYSYSGHLTF